MYWITKRGASRQERHLSVDNLVFSEDIISTLDEFPETISDKSITASGSFSIYIRWDDKNIMISLESEASGDQCP